MTHPCANMIKLCENQHETQQNTMLAFGYMYVYLADASILATFFGCLGIQDP